MFRSKNTAESGPLDAALNCIPTVLKLNVSRYGPAVGGGVRRHGCDTHRVARQAGHVEPYLCAIRACALHFDLEFTDDLILPGALLFEDGCVEVLRAQRAENVASSVGGRGAVERVVGLVAEKSHVSGRAVEQVSVTVEYAEAEAREPLPVSAQITLPVKRATSPIWSAIAPPHVPAIAAASSVSGDWLSAGPRIGVFVSSPNSPRRCHCGETPNYSRASRAAGPRTPCLPT